MRAPIAHFTPTYVTGSTMAGHVNAAEWLPDSNGNHAEGQCGGYASEL